MQTEMEMKVTVDERQRTMEGFRSLGVIVSILSFASVHSVYIWTGDILSRIASPNAGNNYFEQRHTVRQIDQRLLARWNIPRRLRSGTCNTDGKQTSACTIV